MIHVSFRSVNLLIKTPGLYVYIYTYISHEITPRPTGTVPIHVRNSSLPTYDDVGLDVVIPLTLKKLVETQSHVSFRRRIEQKVVVAFTYNLPNQISTI